MVYNLMRIWNALGLDFHDLLRRYIALWRIENIVSPLYLDVCNNNLRSLSLLTRILPSGHCRFSSSNDD